VGWWRAEGNALDSAGTNSGTPQNGVTYVSGFVGQPFSFNGTGQYVAMIAEALTNIESLTFSKFFSISARIQKNPASEGYCPLCSFHLTGVV
jgi:hypothetical protein